MFYISIWNKNAIFGRVMNNFVAIDFETATSEPNSACQVGIVTFRDGLIDEEYESLIQPPGNEYWYWNTKIHGISSGDTLAMPNFGQLADEIIPRLENQVIVAHNAPFDYKVLRKSMEYYDLDFDSYAISSQWECTLKIYRRQGFRKNNLKACCDRLNIKLNHHDALSDARGCAMLYQMRNQ